MIKKRNPFPIAAVFFLLNLVGSIFRTWSVSNVINRFLWQLPSGLRGSWLVGILMRWVGYSSYPVNFLWVLSFLFLMVLCIALFIKRRNVFLIVALGLQCLIPLYNWGDNLLSVISNIEYLGMKYQTVSLLTSTLTLCAVLIMLFIAIANIQKKSGPSKLAGIANKLWFLPGVLKVLHTLPWCVYYLNLYSWNRALARDLVVLNIMDTIVPTVAWLMLGLWFKQCWKAEVAAVQAAQEAYIPAQPVYQEPVYEAPVYEEPVYVAPAEPAPAAAPQKTTDELREYKQLLDDGVITQEEFDAKKKQLLGL